MLSILGKLTVVFYGRAYKIKLSALYVYFKGFIARSYIATEDKFV